MRPGVFRRWLILLSLTIAMVLAAMGTAGASAPGGTRPVGTVSGGPLIPARQAAAAAKPAGCFHGAGPCVSSDPDLSFSLYSNGDTTGCTFDVTVDWGDGGGAVSQPPLQGAPNGTKVGDYSHKYKDPGSYPVTWTATLASNTGFNSCQNNSFTSQFTLIAAGIYMPFSTLASVTKAAADGWGLIANVAGRQCATYRTVKGKTTCKAAACSTDSYVHPTGTDLNVQRGLSIQASPYYPAWVSYWTPAIPASGASLYGAGYLAGAKAAAELESVAGRVIRPSTPAYVVLDYEESPSGISCGNSVKPPYAKKNGDKQCWDWDPKSTMVRNCFIVSPEGWKQFALGWKAGILSRTSPLSLTPAVYVNAGQYGREGVGAWGLPVFIALNPVLRAGFTGRNIVGYAAYGADAVCGDAPKLINHVRGWGGIATIQFHDATHSTVYCKP